MGKRKLISFDWALKKLLRSKTKLDVMKLPEAERRAYERYLEDLSYQPSMIQSSYGIGKKEGWKEGREVGWGEVRTPTSTSIVGFLCRNQEQHQASSPST